MKKNILIIETHPDDGVLSFGGLIAKTIHQGGHVHLHTLCVGGPCNNTSTEVRIQESLESAKILGFDWTYDDRELDGLLDTIPNCELTGIIDKMIQYEKPEEVYCTAFSEHSDHKATVNAFLGSARLKAGYMPKLFAIGQYVFSDQLYSYTPGGKIFNPLSEEDFEKKCQAFGVMKSQCKPYPSPLGVEGIRKQSEYYGLMCGHKYAELYYQLRYIRSL